MDMSKAEKELEIARLKKEIAEWKRSQATYDSMGFNYSIDQTIEESLRNLDDFHELLKARRSAGYERQERLTTFVILGRDYNPIGQPFILGFLENAEIAIW